MPRKTAIIQARMGSTRFPGKVMEMLQDKPVLQWVIDRIRRAKLLDEVVVATSTASADDVIDQWCSQRRVPCFRGSEPDVLDRYASSAAAFRADWIIRVNADNPLVDPTYVDELLADALNSGVEYESYRLSNGTPVMLTALSFFTEAITSGCLERANKAIDDSLEREHVTLGMYRRPSAYRVRFLNVPDFCEDERLRFTVDTPEDLDILRRICSILGDGAGGATAEEIVATANMYPEWLESMAALNAKSPKGER